MLARHFCHFPDNVTYLFSLDVAFGHYLEYKIAITTMF